MVKKLTGPIAAALLVLPSVSTAATRDDADSAINAAANQITNLIQAARASNDQVKLSCLNDSLSKVNALRSSADFDGAMAQAAAYKDEASSCKGANGGSDDEESASNDEEKDGGKKADGDKTAGFDATDAGTASHAVGNNAAANGGSAAGATAGADAPPPAVAPPVAASPASPVT